MNQPPDDSRTPNPELLAAFMDGELDKQPELAVLRARVEQWLVAHPEAAAQLDEQRELSRLVGVTPTPEPSPADWARVLAGIAQGVKAAPKRRPLVVPLGGIAAASLAAAVILGMWIQTRESPAPRDQRALQQPQATNDQAKADARSGSPRVREISQPAMASVVAPGRVEVLQVVSADEVEILRVSGADAGTVVVGQLPVSGPMQWLQPHEVQVTPPTGGDGRTLFWTGAGSLPMIWTLLPSENGQVQK